MLKAICTALAVFVVTGAVNGSHQVIIRDFNPDQGICRAQRAVTFTATVNNPSQSDSTVQARIILPKQVKLIKNKPVQQVTIKGALSKVYWKAVADKPGNYKIAMEVTKGGALLDTKSFDLRFIEPMPIKKMSYIPPPKPVKTDILVGAHNCPLWEADRPTMWSQLLKHPERTPALGFYAQENPEVADWETKWAVEHGVSYFIYCWYRASQGEPVKMHFGSAIHQSLFKSKFRNHMKYTIMWENQSKGLAGVSDENDLMNNLMPFWMENYFTDPNYLKVDNKPVLFIYRPEYLVDDLGSVTNVVKAFDKMRDACKKAGFDGLYILGEYRGLDPNHLNLVKSLGLDYTFAYCWYIPDNPTPQVAIKAQMKYINETQKMNILPQVVTVSQAWSGWADEGTIWKIPPTQFTELLKQAKNFITTLPKDQLGSKMLILDNWNEWGEGHYIAPYREYGFGYLDAVRKVFSNAPAKHTDLLPMDIGMGPYDKAYKKYTEQQDKLREMVSKSVRKPGSEENGLTAWWAFDEESDSPVVYDYSGNRLGGGIYKTSRVKGIDGNALDCQGGYVLIPSNPLLSPPDGFTIECWLYTDVAGQNDKWIVNRIYGGKTNTGYRLGFTKGRPCFAVPQSDWSHHLTADRELPLGVWVNLAATYDGSMMKIYMDGEECASLERKGPVNPNDFSLCLGSFAEDHTAHFTGVMDEVKLYNRALSSEEIKKHIEQMKK